ncbi:hypothetical protein PHISCL_10381, partial [Aspergillus sclerotialis]
NLKRGHKLPPLLPPKPARKPRASSPRPTSRTLLRSTLPPLRLKVRTCPSAVVAASPKASKTRATRTTPRRTTAAVEVDEAVMAPTTTVTIPGRDHLHLRNLLLDHRRLDPLRSSLALMDPSVTTGLQDMGPQDTKVLKATVHVLDFVAVEAFIEAVEDRTIIMGLTHAPHHVVDPSPAVGRAQHPASIWAIFLVTSASVW